MKSVAALACLSVVTSLLAAEPSTRPALGVGTLLSFSFDDANVWPAAPATPGAGTIDVAGAKDGSAGLSVALDAGATNASITSGPLAVANVERDLAKLTLAFSLSASAPRPVRVTVESFDADKRRTGSLHATIYPAAADYYQRFALDLSTMTADGAFDPCAPNVAFAFALDRADGWPTDAPATARVDNVHYARPAFYVSPAGDDARDGLTEATAFATPQHALDVARAGDVILLAGGTYANPPGSKETMPVVDFVRPGAPAAWITVRAAPGATPVLDATARQAVHIQKGPAPAGESLGYLEVRGLTVRGNGDTARERYADEIGKSSPHVDAMGVVVWGRGTMLHHVRLADNTIEHCTGDGLHVDSADWIAIEHNTIRDNLATTIGYAPAGLTIMKYANFDAVENVPKFLIGGNRVSGNKMTVKNMPYGKEPKTGFYNGNGILIDANAENPPAVYAGRTLVQNNLVYDNGGGGIQQWGNHRVDLVNNTVVRNGTVVRWGQMGFERCADVRLMNNVIVAPPDTTLDSWFAHGDKAATVARTSNLFFGGSKPNLPGTDDHVGDPKFAKPTTQPSTADYRPAPGSPAIGAGRWDAITPAADLDGKPRPYGGAPTLGALEP